MDCRNPQQPIVFTHIYNCAYSHSQSLKCEILFFISFLYIFVLKICIFCSNYFSFLSTVVPFQYQNFGTIGDENRINFPSLWMVPLAGNRIFNSFFSDLAFLPILPQTMSSKSLSNLDFIIESILANYKKNFLQLKDSYNSFT